jgi:hypothetical protein
MGMDSDVYKHKESWSTAVPRKRECGIGDNNRDKKELQ